MKLGTRDQKLSGNEMKLGTTDQKLSRNEMKFGIRDQKLSSGGVTINMNTPHFKQSTFQTVPASTRIEVI
jgi:hypothetical protein